MNPKPGTGVSEGRGRSGAVSFRLRPPREGSMVSTEHPIEEPVQAFCPHVLNLKKGAEGITRAADALFRIMALLEHSFRGENPPIGRFRFTPSPLPEPDHLPPDGAHAEPDHHEDDRVDEPELPPGHLIHKASSKYDGR